MREVVDLPEATEPATPMMNGILLSSAPRNRVVTRCSRLRRLDIERDEAAERQVDFLGLLPARSGR